MTTVLGILALPFDVFWMRACGGRGGGFLDPNRLYDDGGVGSLYRFSSKRVDTPQRSAAGLVVSIVSTRRARPQRAVSVCMAERVDRGRLVGKDWPLDCDATQATLARGTLLTRERFLL
jgi:hypothetical protein